MGRIGMAIRLVFFIPAMWITMAVLILALVVNGWEPGMDIANYAIERLF